jgi:hypothetical protein
VSQVLDEAQLERLTRILLRYYRGDYICTGTDVDDAHHHYNSDPWLTTTVDYLVDKLIAAGVEAA